MTGDEAHYDWHSLSQRDGDGRHAGLRQAGRTRRVEGMEPLSRCCCSYGGDVRGGSIGGSGVAGGSAASTSSLVAASASASRLVVPSNHLAAAQRL